MELELTGIYPIILDGEKTGEIKVSRDGLFWRFEARNEMRSELIRLSVYGDGLEGYLGVMEPCGQELTLTKKLSKTALSGFPKNISFGSRKGEQVMPIEQAAASADTVTECTDCDTEVSSPPVAENCTACAITAPPDENKPPPKASVLPPVAQYATQWTPCACPCSLFSGIEGKNIGSTIHGALISETKEGVLLAVPSIVASTLPKTNYMHFLDHSDIYGFEYDVFLV